MLPHHPPGMNILIRNEFLWVHIIQEPFEALTVQPLSELHTLRYVPVILALNKTFEHFPFQSRLIFMESSSSWWLIVLSGCIILFI